MYDSLLEWDAKLNNKPALAEPTSSTRSGSSGTCGRASSSTTARSSRPPTPKYSFDQILNPPLPGTTATIGQVPGIAGTTVLSKYKLRWT
jgi:hypothetical protein